MDTNTDTSPQAAPPYFAFKTLLTILDQMKEKGIPNRIDRTFLVGMSGAGQTQFITGLKALGLIDAAGTVQPKLTNLAEANPAQRKALLSKVIQDTYPEAVALGETNATTGELVEVFRNYGATGDTARKAIAFFLKAARYAGDIQLSPHFVTPKVTSASGARKTRRPTVKSTNGGETNNPPQTELPALHPALAGVLSELPPMGQGWTAERRTQFMTTFEAVANFTIPVVEDETDDEPLEDEAPNED